MRKFCRCFHALAAPQEDGVHHSSDIGRALVATSTWADDVFARPTHRLRAERRNFLTEEILQQRRFHGPYGLNRGCFRHHFFLANQVQLGIWVRGPGTAEWHAKSARLIGCAGLCVWTELNHAGGGALAGLSCPNRKQRRVGRPRQRRRRQENSTEDIGRSRRKSEFREP